MKYLLVLLVVGVVVWMLVARQRSRPVDSARPKKGRPADKPAAMLACAHCAVLLPPEEAVHDAGGRVFCSEAHRLAGPR